MLLLKQCAMRCLTPLQACRPSAPVLTLQDTRHFGTLQSDAGRFELGLPNAMCRFVQCVNVAILFASSSCVRILEHHGLIRFQHPSALLPINTSTHSLPSRFSHNSKTISHEDRLHFPEDLLG